MSMTKRFLKFIAMMPFVFLAACDQKQQAAFSCPDIAAGCVFDGLTISTDHAPQILKPFKLTVELSADAVLDAREVYASFAMAGMEMGLNRYRLIKRSDHLWAAEVTLPMCVRGRADWLLQIETKAGFGSNQYLIAFQTG